jgi:uncharacterized membrane protein YphA (DoxX/SURF4 family)
MKLRAWLILGARVLLGATFVLAALPKIADPPGFAKAIWNYHLVPDGALAPLALVLPWLELQCGMAMALGVWVRPTAAWVSILLTAFLLALGLNLYRGRPVDCGCFGSGAAPKSEAQRLSDMKLDLARDAGLLALALLVLMATGQARPDSLP